MMDNKYQSEVLKMLLNEYSVRLKDGQVYKIVYFGESPRLYKVSDRNLFKSYGMGIRSFLKNNQMSNAAGRFLHDFNIDCTDGDMEFKSVIMLNNLLNGEIVMLDGDYYHLNDDWYLEDDENLVSYDYTLEDFIKMCNKTDAYGSEKNCCSGKYDK